ncbi:twin-arginine translocation signal domain-containing protein, partial [Bacillus cereus group sp. BC244]
MRLTRKTQAPAASGLGISRRQFLKRTGAGTAGVAAVGFMGAPMMQRTE